VRFEGATDLLEHYERTRGQGFGPEVKRRIMLGTFALASGYYDAYYARAQRVRTLIVRDFARVFDDVDLLLSPTSPTVAFGFGERTDDPYAMYLSDVCTIPTSLAGLPALSIPCGRSDGLPVGLQIIGPAFSENRLLGAAHALETAIGFDEVPEGVA
jgi:aspartyl-tRNA(Asn)/glutamyl-tRNA(Gln) amidotransferase subunit A